MTRGRSGSEAGFTLVEMLVALTITLIVSGSIYGLLAGGQSAFRREPELTDRQQNIRIAMNVIMRDIANAGSGMPPFIQTFTRNLDACTSGTTCPVNNPPNTGHVTSSENQQADELEMLTNTGARENEPVCHTPGNGNAANIRLVRNTTGVPTQTVVLLFTTDGGWTLRNVVDTSTNNSQAYNCDNAPHTQLNFNSGSGDQSGLNTPSGVCEPNGWGTVTGAACTVNSISFATVVRYRLRRDASGVPVLQRWSSDDVTALSSGGIAGAAYQTIARGIEDLQVQYTQVGTPTTWVNGAPQVTNGNYQSLINQVRVTLVSRVLAPNLQGQRTSASGQANIRGTLTSIGTPRATLINVTNDPAPPSPAPLWQ